ncbi:hypothetical protein L6164_003016 [Bauhinia variegata]|uniref:Uncharacterized protein n=1 Tax=Bauhinia variegata TaxID=167791 RepID=A0ACB9PZE2_BAUVA|nr:hypothetical protein L6164_003016 [Bauhinia variegata]
MNHRDLLTKTSAKPRKAYAGEDLTFQLIDGNGNFNDQGLKDFAREANLLQCGRSYAIVAIMGPQSSGKSTLLNHLFRTNFKMMDDSEGRSQTTQGIWLARCPDIKPLTLVMDMEGSDGSERGEDDASFEKQSALFALAVADVVLINMWCQDIGREHAANKPLLRTVFQQVMVQFSNKPRKITLMFAVRDKTKSPETTLEAKLREDIGKMWTSILKLSGCSNLQLQDFFKVQVVFLPNYEEREQDFKLKVQQLKQRFVNSTAPGGLADTGKEPASGFLISAHNIWNDIMANMDLDLPAHKIMVATARCEEIKNEQYNSFLMNKELHNLCKDAHFGFVPDFGKRVNSILNACVSKYDEEALNFDEDVANEKREELIHQSLQLVEPEYQAMVNHLRLKQLEKFMETFDKGSDEQNRFSTVADHIQYCLNEFDQDCAAIKVDRAMWDPFKARAKLGRHMKSYAATKREDRPALKVRRLYEPKIKQELSNSIRYLLCEDIDPTWSKIRKHFDTVMEPTLTQLDNTLSEFGVHEEARKEMLERLLEYAKDVVGAKAREESGRAKSHMMRKFVKHFKYDDDSSPRQWNNSDEIQKTAKAALSYPLNLLASLAAMRLEETDEDDNILETLSSELLEKDQNALNYVDSPIWEKVPSSKTLITPIQCKELWETFMVEAQNTINDALEVPYCPSGEPAQPAVYGDKLHQLRQEHLNKFIEEFDKHSDEWRTFTTAAEHCIKNCLLEFDDHCEDLNIERANENRLKARDKLQHDINSYIAAKCEDKLTSKIKHLEPAQPVVNGYKLNQLRKEHLNKFIEVFDKYSDEQNTFITAADDCIKNCLFEFDKHCEDQKIERANEDRLKARDKLQHDINSYIAAKREEKLASKIRSFEAKLKPGISDYVEHILCEETDPSWSKVREYFKGVIDLNLPKFRKILSEFSIDEEARQRKIESIKEYIKDLIINKAREESSKAKNHMITKFRQLFKHECNSKRDRKGDVQIEEAYEAVLFLPLKVLAGLVVTRMEESETDEIEETLSSALSHSRRPNTSNALDSSDWKEIPSSRTLLKPMQCKQLWMDYLVEAKEIANQARMDLETKKNPGIVKKFSSVIWGERRSRGTQRMARNNR